MPYLYENPILNIGVYYDKESMDDDPSIHPFDNGIAGYSASTIRDHFDTAEKTAAMFGLRRKVKMCVLVKIPYDGKKIKYSGYYEVWQDLKNYNDITDHPEEEHVLKKWRVIVEQRCVFYEEAETEQEARRIVAEDRIWDDTSDEYDFEISTEAYSE